MIHKSVLLHESIDGLEIKKGDVFVDGTLGNGGHTEIVAKRFGDAVVMIGIDLDPEAISRTKERLAPLNVSVKFAEESFRHIDKVIKSLGVAQVDKILLDIGLSSNQFEESGRGFSFQKNEPLIMSFKKDLTENDLTAREIVNTWEAENIQAILSGYGEEQFAWKIAKAIVARREESPIETTFDLVEIIKIATPKFYHHRKIHPATKTFQALRIAVNDELESLKDGLKNGFDSLSVGGMIAVISFHSLEDRIVKRFFKEKEESEKGERVTKRPVTAKDSELKENPRARSAKLRIFKKTAN
ncbi:MAG: 16S rRNA (cytosine(1402)-N(4))-methyltransferase RsmH [Patescibacteria group bacterium]